MITVRFVFRYVFMVVSIAVLCYMVSYDNLIWIAYAAAAAGIISAVICVISRKNFTVSVFTKESSLEEGRRMEVIVRLEKTGFCLLPLVEMAVCCGSSEVIAAGSLLFNRSTDIPVSIDVSTCGMTTITARAGLVHDFVDVVCFRSKIGDSLTVAVMPRLREYPFSIKLSKDDGDESPEFSRVSLSGMPGSEIRQYQEGDPLRSISYKISAKYGRLLTRLNENGGGRTVNVLIASGAGCNAARLALGLAKQLSEQGMIVITEYCGNSFAASRDEIESLRRWLSVQYFGTQSENTAVLAEHYDFYITETDVTNGIPVGTEVSYAYRCEGPGEQ